MSYMTGAERQPQTGAVALNRSLPPRATWHITWDRLDAAGNQPSFDNVAAYLKRMQYCPHIMWDPVTGRTVQFYPSGLGSRALAAWNEDGAENIQVEIYFSPNAVRNGKRYATVADTPLVGLDALIAYMDGLKIPRVWPMGSPQWQGNKRDVNIWNTKGGHYGHCHVPNNTNSDPGPMPSFAAQPKPDTGGTGLFKMWPVKNPSISQRFGVVSARGPHLGVDLRPDYPGQIDKAIYAPADGVVVYAGGKGHAAGNPWEQIPGNGNNGNSLILQHLAPHQAAATSYNHLRSYAVKVGQFVKAGTFLGYMGWTGLVLPANPDGTHLHWEMFIDYGNGQYPIGTFYGRVNPLDYFAVETTVPVDPGPGGGGGTGTKPPGPVRELLIPGLPGLHIDDK